VVSNFQVILNPNQAQLIVENKTENMMEIKIRALNDVYIGGEEIDNTNGFKIECCDSESIKLGPKASLYGYSLTETRLFVMTSEII
jgi:hypothetical protein